MIHKIFVWILLFVILCPVVVGCGTSKSADIGSAGSGFTPAQVCAIPNVVGLSESVANDQLVGLGLQPVKTTQYDASVAEGSVISQDPPVGTRKEPCQGDVTIVVSLGPVPGPTATPAPPPSPTPIPPTPTSTPDLRLFWDDFESGIKPEWGMSGSGFFAANGKLTAEKALFESRTIGGNDWHNYRVRLVGLKASPGFQVLVRVQDRGNYMLFGCNWHAISFMASTSSYTWRKATKGEEQEVPGTSSGDCIEGNIDIEVEGNIYRAYLNGKQISYFADDSYSKGGFAIRMIEQKNVVLDDIEVMALP